MASSQAGCPLDCAFCATGRLGLRRDLVDFGYLRRERGGGKYWLAPDDEKQPGQ